MITKTLYTCQFCNTDYTNKEKAMECEKNHKVLETATIIGNYKSLKSIPDGCPTKVKENVIFVRTTMNMKGVNGDVITMKTLNQIMTELLQKQKKKEYL